MYLRLPTYFENGVLYRDVSPDVLMLDQTRHLQIEEAANEDGKGPSIWDTFTEKFPGAEYALYQLNNKFHQNSISGNNFHKSCINKRNLVSYKSQKLTGAAVELVAIEVLAEMAVDMRMLLVLVSKIFLSQGVESGRT